jgi:predicted proteasome-type protease
METLHVVPAGGDSCDFCSSRAVFKIYNCHNFLVPWTKTMLFQRGVSRYHQPLVREQLRPGTLFREHMIREV